MRILCYIDQQFLPVKKGQLGLRQSEALFHHVQVLPGLLAELNQQVPLHQIERVGVSARPRPVEGSYMPCFLAGVNAAASFAMAKDIPVVQTTHQQGHITAALYAAAGRELFSAPALVFHISGGTTDLLYCKSIHEIECIGTSSDLYAGQAVDRIGVKLGFEFPAGKINAVPFGGKLLCMNNGVGDEGNIGRVQVIYYIRSCGSGIQKDGIIGGNKRSRISGNCNLCLTILFFPF